MKKKSLGTGNSWSLIFTIALALFNLGIFGLILLTGNQLNKIIRQNFEVQIFLSKDSSPEQTAQIQDLLSKKPFVAILDGKPSVRFTSKEEAGRKFMEETGENFARFLGENPLRHAFTIKISEGYLSQGNLKTIKEELAKIPGVFEVVYIENLIGSIQDNLQKVSALFLGIAGMFLLTAGWLIRNTVKLAVFSQRFLIRTMELVGAEPWFIQKPYVVSMLWRGITGGFFASVFLLLGIHFAGNYVPQIKTLLIPEEIGLVLLFLPLMGSIIGSASAWWSVRRFQGKKLDDLHIY